MSTIKRKTTTIIDDETFDETVEMIIDMGRQSDLHIMSVLGTKTGTVTYTITVYVGNGHGDFIEYDTLSTLSAAGTQFKTYTDFPTSTAKVKAVYTGTGNFANVKTDAITVER